MGETGRALGVRLNEHKKEAEDVSKKKFTRAARKDSFDERHKSAISDHVARDNHVINWEDAKVVDRESVKQARWIREAIYIRRRGDKVINCDEGIYSLSHVYDQALPPLHSGDETTVKSQSASPKSTQY